MKDIEERIRIYMDYADLMIMPTSAGVALPGMGSVLARSA